MGSLISTEKVEIIGLPNPNKDKSFLSHVFSCLGFGDSRGRVQGQGQAYIDILNRIKRAETQTYITTPPKMLLKFRDFLWRHL